MKNYLFYSFLMLISLSFYACSSQNKKTEETVSKALSEENPIEQKKGLPPLEEGEVFLKGEHPFGDEIPLTGHHVEEVDTFIIKPQEPRMIIEGDRLYMSSMGAPYFVFNFPELTYRQTIGTVGNGPDEFFLPYVLKSPDGINSCYLYERSRNNLYGLDAHGEMHFIKKLFDGKSPFGETENLYAIDDHTFMYVKNAIMRLTIEGDSIVTKDIYPLRLKNARGVPITGTFAVNPTHNRMVYAYKYAKIVKFMDLEAQTIRTLNFQQSSFDEKTLNIADGLDQNVTYYMEAIPTEDYVYITYSGRTPMVVANEVNKGNRYMYIEKYDWNGNPISIYKLNEFSVYPAIDEDSLQLVLCCYYYDDPFVVFHLE